jgi:hypothetical protein
MLLQLEEKLPGHAPRKIFLCYIPHDIRRMGIDCFVGLPKPRLRVRDGRMTVVPPEPIGEYYRDLLAANRHGWLSVWYVANKLRNLMYSNPKLYADAYAAALGHVAQELTQVAEANHCQVYVVALPNLADQVSSEVLGPLAASVFSAASRPGVMEFVDLAPCLRSEEQAGGVDFREFVQEHPGPAGHAALARCLKPYL